MNKKTKNDIKRNVSNSFGALGYLSGSLLWFWTVLLYFNLLEKFVIYLTPPTKPQPAPNPAPIVAVNSNVFYYVIGGVVVAAVIALTLYMFYKIPSTIIKTGKKMVHESAEVATDFVATVQHKKETKKFRIKMTARLMLTAKFILIILPVVLSFASQYQAKPYFDFFVAMYVSMFLAGFSIVMFIGQYLMAYFMKVQYAELW